jgi:tRNA pseudouridine32 synthase/23S rRNA pseudouridine746 synthase
MAHVMQAIDADLAQRAWFEQGKMLGVLVVRSGESLAFLAAYSGQFELGGLDYFVPPVFDLSKPHGFYLNKDREISAFNEEIARLEQDAAYVELCKVREEYKVRSQAQIEAYKAEMQAAKARRDLLRAEATMELDGSDKMRIDLTKPQIDLNLLIQESQFQKAELRRLKMAQKAQLVAYETEIERYRAQIVVLKRERKERSESLQREIFEHFRFHNGRGEERSLMEIFRTYSPDPLPPAGAGECAGPRLLEYALRHGWQPLSMAEFWYGRPTRESNRKHGCCYPPCQEKCAPILGFMLEGLAVAEVASAAREVGTETSLEVLYEDEALMIVDKPGGVLSVPGRGAHPYVLQLLQRTHPEALSYAPVHRLDMDTSGLLLIAKSARAHRALQRLFIERKVEKRYQAWLEGEVRTSCGVIRLPLSPDPYHRPRQRVNRETGKCALSYYEVLRRVEGRTLVSFMPLTGRTHQLRLHASAGEGLHTPIVGDPLYGGQHEQESLLLHACYLKLAHPFTGKVIEVERLRW